MEPHARFSIPSPTTTERLPPQVDFQNIVTTSSQNTFLPEISSHVSHVWNSISSHMQTVELPRMHAIGKSISDNAQMHIDYFKPHVHSVAGQVANTYTKFMDKLPEYNKDLYQRASQASIHVKDSIALHIQAGAQKSQEVWTHLIPYVRATSEILKSDIGLSTSLVLGGIVCLKISQNVESRIASFALLLIGVAATMASGIYMMRSGILPELPQATGNFRLPFASTV